MIRIKAKKTRNRHTHARTENPAQRNEQFDMTEKLLIMELWS